MAVSLKIINDVYFVVENTIMEIIVVMGVSGSGKSTIAELLSKELTFPYYDADDFHPQQNLVKMKSGQALTDEDRYPWLDILAKKMLEITPIVIACSALKESYRSHLISAVTPKGISWVYLKGTKEVILERMKAREHFMPINLLDSQFEALEEPLNAIRCSIDNPPLDIVNQILNQLKSHKF